MVKLEKPQKIGTTEWMRIRSHARVLYLPLSGDLIGAFGLKKGDLLKVEIQEVRKGEEAEKDEDES